MNRHRHMLANLRTKVTQMASALNMSSFHNRDNLLGLGTKYLGWWLMMGDDGAGISGRCPSPLMSMVLNIGDMMAQCLHLQGIVLLKISTLILRKYVTGTCYANVAESGESWFEHVSRLIVKNTIEDKILAFQDKKRKMAALAFGEDQSGTSTGHLTNEDLRFLFMGAR
ncbi:hypothetical protein Hdeb2414_s0001g00017941 [Helianthus debilis subsp. tardiflorus]